MKIAIIGAGRMGSLVAKRLPPDVEHVALIDRNEAKAQALCALCGGAATASAAAAGAADADMLLFVLPAEATAAAMREAAALAKPGAILVNMATNGAIPDGLGAQYPALTFVDAKIIGHAGAMAQGARGIVVAGTADTRVLDSLTYALSGLGPVERGDASLVPQLNTIGSTEGIRAAVAVRRQLAAFGVPAEWTDTVIETVCAGTMRAYVENDLGGFGRALAERFETE